MAADIEVRFVVEDTLESQTVAVSNPSAAELKDMASKLFGLLPDTECTPPGRPMVLMYPIKIETVEGSNRFLEQSSPGPATQPASEAVVRRTKHHRHQGHVWQIADNADWGRAKEHWDGSAKLRREAALVRLTAEVAEVCCQGEVFGRSSGVVGPHALEASLRLCSLLGVPQNLASLASLHKVGLTYEAVVGLLEYRDPAASPGHHGGAREVRDNCEPLVLACGAHLHWHLSTCSPLYWERRVRPAAANSFNPGDDGVPPQYEKFQRLLFVGQSKKVLLFFCYVVDFSFPFSCVSSSFLLLTIVP